MSVLLAILKIVGVLLLAVLSLILVMLLLPLGFAVEYKPSRIRVSAVYGPLRRTVWSHRMHHQTSRRESSPLKPESSKDTTAAPSPPQDAAQQVPASSDKTQPAQKERAEQPSAEAPPPQEAVLPEEEEEELPPGAMGRIQRMVLLLEENPRALANCVLGHMRWLHRHSIFKMSIRHVNIFWTVTCEDAAATAVAYGAEIAALNTTLALVQQNVRIQSDRLWLEPDFTGARRSERRISCTVSASAILMVHLLYRIWKDPLLQPAE